MRIIGPEIEPKLDWLALCDALAAGHDGPRAQVEDSFLYRGGDTILNRAAWIDGMGALVKTATIFPDARPAINGGAMLFDDRSGGLAAVIDFHLLTKWKTAGDSLLAARRLRPEAGRILIVGAGTVGRSVREAFGAGYPGAAFEVWNRSPAAAEVLVANFAETRVVIDLEAAVAGADIVVGCTMATEPWLRGAWLRPGQHVNLIGAYRPDMREADDAAVTRARLFLDSRETVLGHIGELKIPTEAGIVSDGDIVADFYGLDGFAAGPEDITLFKNGGGAHLDLMTALW
ncbi:MAG: ornithine cyclodeaminase family protein, partial [Shimia sp.]